MPCSQLRLALKFGILRGQLPEKDFAGATIESNPVTLHHLDNTIGQLDVKDAMVDIDDYILGSAYRRGSELPGYDSSVAGGTPPGS